MPFAVQMLFDPEVDAEIRALQELIAKAAAPSLGPEARCRPHVCLAAAKSVALRPLEAELASFVREMPPLCVDFSGVGVLSEGPRIIYLGVVPTRELLAIHDDLYAMFRTHAVSPSPRYEPDAWTPHCTLAMGLDGPVLATALEACLHSPQPPRARIVGVGLAELSPAKSQMLVHYDCTR